MNTCAFKTVNSEIFKYKAMKKNIGTTDKVIRLIIGVLIYALGIIYKSWWGLLALFLLQQH